MAKNSFLKEAMTENHPQYEKAIQRKEPLYQRENDLRSPFSRDYNRIIFSLAYRRLKHKTQVFFAVEDDHVCTRSEHVNLVDSVSYTIANYLGLNTELTRSIAVGHDLGHAPFGHGGEKIINTLCKENDLPAFWHEKNSLYFVDEIDTLEDNHHIGRNLNLIIDEKQVEQLKKEINMISSYHFDAINNGTIVNYFILDVCQNSSLEKGICLSDEAFEVMKIMMSFNYKNIYLIDRIEVHTNYVQLILNSIFQFLYKYETIAKEHQTNVIEALKKDQKKYPITIQGYIHWLEKYSQMRDFKRNTHYQNHIIYDFDNDSKAMVKSIIDYLSGMSDAYILKIFNEFISFS